MDDFLIIGSGFGGAVAAHELTQAGAKVTLIERGPWRDTLPMRSSARRCGLSCVAVMLPPHRALTAR